MTAPPDREALAVLAAVPEALVRAAGDLEAATAVLRGGSAGVWQGPAAEAGARAGVLLADRGRALAVAAGPLAGAVAAAVAGFTAAREALDVARDLAAAAPGSSGAGVSTVEAREREAAARRSAALARADEVDAVLAAALDSAALDSAAPGGVRGAAPGGGAPGPVTLAAVAPGGIAPVEVGAWWSALDPMARDALVRGRPDLVGGLDGIPAADRDRANRLRLGAAARSAEDAERRSLVALAEARDPVTLVRAGLQWHEVRRRLDRLRAVDASLRAVDRALLAFEDGPSGVRAAVAAGDVTTAAHVGVFTPGFTSEVTGLSSRLAELEAVRAQAGPGTATVAWSGYDAPQWSGVLDPDRSVLGDRAARAGSVPLSSFLDGLDAARPADAHVTAVGHSYGSVTTGLTLGAGGAAGLDDAVHLGSPGIGDTARPAGRTWVAEAAGDPVADAGWFGPDPNRMPGVTGLSAREVVLPDGRTLAGSRGHGDYLTPGTTSSHDVAAVVGGRPETAVLDRGVGVGDRLRSLVGG